MAGHVSRAFASHSSLHVQELLVHPAALYFSNQTLTYALRGNTYPRQLPVPTLCPFHRPVRFLLTDAAPWALISHPINKIWHLFNRRLQSAGGHNTVFTLRCGWGPNVIQRRQYFILSTPHHSWNDALFRQRPHSLLRSFVDFVSDEKEMKENGRTHFIVFRETRWALCPTGRRYNSRFIWKRWLHFWWLGLVRISASE